MNLTCAVWHRDHSFAQRCRAVKSRPEWSVMPTMLNAAEPVGAVNRAITSSGCICPEGHRSFTVSLWIIAMTRLFPTPPGPLINSWYGLTGCPTTTALLHQALWNMTTCLCFLLRPLTAARYSSGERSSLLVPAVNCCSSGVLVACCCCWKK